MRWSEILLVSVKTTSQEPKEIIEFGIGLFDLKEIRLKESFSVFVKPTRKLTEHCSKTTGVAASDLEDAATFFDLYEFVDKNFNSKGVPWASYGNLSLNVITKQCLEKNVDHLFSDRFINLRHLFALLSGSFEISLEESLLSLGVHVASNSCEDEIYNCAILLKVLLSKQEENLLIENVSE